MSGKPLFTRTTTPDLLGTLLKSKDCKRKLRKDNYKRQEALAKVSGNYSHPLIFEYWLAGQGVDKKLFWKNCKAKYSNNGSSRKTLKLRDSIEWVLCSFCWECGLTSTEANWHSLHNKWKDVVTTAQYGNRTILFGFGEYGDFK